MNHGKLVFADTRKVYTQHYGTMVTTFFMQLAEDPWAYALFASIVALATRDGFAPSYRCYGGQGREVLVWHGS